MKYIVFIIRAVLVLSAIIFLMVIIPGEPTGDSDPNARTSSNPVNDAFAVCAALEGTGLTTQCKISGWNSKIDVTIDTSGSEARKICAGIVDQVAQMTRSFRGAWKLQIFSPYSGERPIAVCRLL